MVVVGAGGFGSAGSTEPGELTLSTGLECRHLAYRYPNADHTPLNGFLLQKIDRVFPAGQVVLISGISGAGKSTLLHLLAGLRRPTQGEILAASQPVSRWVAAHRDRWRRRVGIIFQQDHLVSGLSVLENVILPLIPRSGEPGEWRSKGMDILTRLNAHQLAGQAVTALSGGQRQRVAAARALVDAPDYIMADEPTAHQDPGNARLVGRLLRQAADRGAVVVVAAHDRHVEEWIAVDQHLKLDNGTLQPVP